MIEVIPSINETSIKDIRNKIEIVEPYVNWVHLDVYDGTFTEHASWHDPNNLIDFNIKPKIEVHLMISDMDTRWQDWALPKVDRIIFHVEAAHDPEFVLNKIKEAKKEVGVAIRPETDWKKLEPFFEKADLVQTLAVSPGHAGQEFRPEIIEKIKHIRKSYPKAIIEVDGGINLETGRQCVEAGANILVSANYIFGSKNIEEAINNLKNL
ncbi:MAG: Ribulose-phosphate 3-epimerase [Candidatus Giovannonibacteria bacterium GW2011_GWB1_45_9b]|uniref:Ribulose-phosphate 3-epimerase n=6 Tax=Candidatus Giovannoniibacteriota TaxID=1752738 RepID=A0A1F5X0T0_9BACT|nr:MAG: Ribulose-phosphate 3-epimerase [Candidatus Giovannonibacteria bacterium GW2011_GWC2_44_8]KKU16592.1 MAG: Ribulose-phosphate 3-epimerase [Candidatus Giovannonibacteria bacterium GW2011_GWB1_45_9b]OGF74000.1 MAG: hypothetical protein A2W57_02095 [Candidatus Giovannonibacteria bacterium RIFCSPHIGHO2_02_43_16]OGF81508.1 MAG: hypothetical protein A2W48_01720 [Candidatus Giovannonibacteria bacterium RIFCSPHIGHO2_12_44_12]OGF84123.1 MAG: hypothetical protein A2Z63_02950 [Candidatus Giovannonib